MQAARLYEQTDNFEGRSQDRREAFPLRLGWNMGPAGQTSPQLAEPSEQLLDHEQDRKPRCAQKRNRVPGETVFAEMWAVPRLGKKPRPVTHPPDGKTRSFQHACILLRPIPRTRTAYLARQYRGENFSAPHLAGIGFDACTVDLLRVLPRSSASVLAYPLQTTRPATVPARRGELTRPFGWSPAPRPLKSLKSSPPRGPQAPRQMNGASVPPRVLGQ
jgi:hypothetical protein